MNLLHVIKKLHDQIADQEVEYSLKEKKATIGRLHVTSRISRQKKWMTKSSNLCWRGIGRTPTFGVILKTNDK